MQLFTSISLPFFHDHQHPHYKCLSKKSMYSLKQAPRAWYQRWICCNINFYHNVCDYCLLTNPRGDDTTYILIYMEDIFLTASSDTLFESIMPKLSSLLSMKDLSPISYFLGILVTRYSSGFFLSKLKYTKKTI